VINATGTVLHTNLGRAPLPAEVVSLLPELCAGYSNLEFDLEKGKRGNRNDHLTRLICELTGAEDALVVNNNAAAVLLVVTALAATKDVVVSRGELVEIGGGFRIPEVITACGAHLCEVGTTNRTRLRDYQDAITEDTGLLLKVHTSNYQVVGFTESVSTGDLVKLAVQNGIPMVEDLGSGMLLDPQKFGLPPEPTVQETIAAGAQVVTFSGDKLLGGPQAGIIVGTATLIEIIKKHPLARALRMDKLSIATLESVFRIHRDPKKAIENIPAMRMFSLSQSDVAKRAESIADRLRGQSIAVTVIEGTSQVGGGAMPLAELPTALIAITPRDSADRVVANLYRNDPPVIARIRDNQILFDLRTVFPNEEEVLLSSIINCLGSS
jgi:L-seryl-tRNA(Ser) seleniumtransferase